LRLSALLDEADHVLGYRDIEIRDLVADSRAIRGGELFAALSGTQADGHVFIPEALAKGAVALLAGPGAEVYATAVPVIVASNPRLRLARMAARFHLGQPRFTAAVTGTNGKTSIASFTRQIWDGLGLRAASLGTLGVQGRGRWPSSSLTTPDPVTLHRLAAELARAGIDHLVLEASSHGLHQYRLDALTIKAAAFSNISRDHFDYHESFEAYYAAKKRLFAERLADGGTAVLNADAPEFADLKATAEARGCEVVDYGVAARRYRLIDTEAHAAGQRIEVEVEGRRHRFATSLVGSFQAHNLLAALGLAVAGGAELGAALGQLGELRGAPGRMQLVVRHANGAAAFVDYAHTPDALAQALKALRPHTRGRIHLVFGCGGDRDPGKRPLMGTIAAGSADRVYVTDDNPRNEDPARIRAAIMAAAKGGHVVEIGDRGEAIRSAFAALGPGDVLLVAGKGHEAGQIVGGETLPFDDATELKKAASALEGAS